MTRTFRILTFAAAGWATALAGCRSTTMNSDDCTPLEETGCSCPDGSPSTRVCSSDGEYGDCRCDPSEGGAGGAPASGEATATGGNASIGGAPAAGQPGALGGGNSGGMTGGQAGETGSESGGAESGGAVSGGAESGGAVSGGAESGGATSGGAESGGAVSGGAESGGATSGGAESGGVTTGGATGDGGTPSTGGTSETGGTTGGTAMGGAGGGDPHLPPPLDCAVQQLHEETLATASTTAGSDSLTLGCGVGNGNDVAFDWVVPRSGIYAVSTTGSTFDTVLGLRADACDGAEFACVDDDTEQATSTVVGRFVANDRVAIIVDGKAGDAGDVELHLDPVSCPAQDLTEQPMPVELTTLNGTNDHEGACGGASRSERTYGWAAPVDGLFRFTVASDTFDPAIYLEQGGRCGGALLGCNATSMGGYPAEVTRRLAAGELVTIIVDSVQGAGVFTLDVERIAEDCPNGTLGGVGDEPVTQTLVDGDQSILAGSCAQAGMIMVPGGTHSFPDYTFGATIGGRTRCTYHVEADGEFALVLLSGDTTCGGAEQQCVLATEDGGVYSAEVNLGTVSATESQEFVLVVRSLTLNDLTFTLFEPMCMMV